MRFVLLLLPLGAIAGCAGFSGNDEPTTPDDGGTVDDAGSRTDPDVIVTEGGLDADADADAGVLSEAAIVRFDAQPLAISSHGTKVFVSLPMQRVAAIDTAQKFPPSVAGQPFPCAATTREYTALAAFADDQVMGVCSNASDAELRSLSFVTATSVNLVSENGKQIPSLAAGSGRIGFVLNGGSTQSVVTEDFNGANPFSVSLANPVAIARDVGDTFVYATETEVGTLQSTGNSMDALVTSGVNDVARVGATTYWNGTGGIRTSDSSGQIGSAVSIAADADALVWLDLQSKLHVRKADGSTSQIETMKTPETSNGEMPLRRITLTPSWIAVLVDDGVKLVARPH